MFYVAFAVSVPDSYVDRKDYGNSVKVHKWHNIKQLSSICDTSTRMKRMSGGQ